MLKNSEFRRNSLILIVGTGLSQLIPLAVQTVLRRIYSEDDFGLFAQYYSLVAILSIVASLKYERSIVIPQSDKEARHLVVGAISINLIISALILLLLLLFGRWLFDLLGFSPDLIHYIWLIPISVFLIATNIVFNFWLTRKKRFIGQVYNKTFRRGTEAGGQLLFGKISLGGGLIFGSLIGDFCNSIMSFFQFKRSEGHFKAIEKAEVLKNLEEQSEFPRYALLPAVLNVITSYFPIFLLSAFYSEALVGQFDGTRMVLSAPLALVSISISQVLYQRIVEDINAHRTIGRLMRNNALFLTAMAGAGILIFYPFGPAIFKFIFGENWQLAGEFASIVVFAYAIRFIISPLSILFTAVKKLKISAAWQIGYFLLTLNLFWLDDLSAHEFLGYVVLFDLVAYTIYGLLIFYTSRQQDLQLEQ